MKLFRNINGRLKEVLSSLARVPPPVSDSRSLESCRVLFHVMNTGGDEVAAAFNATDHSLERGSRWQRTGHLHVDLRHACDEHWRGVASQSWVGCTGPIYVSSPIYGRMFWFSRKKFVGSYFRLSARSRSYLALP